MSVNCSYCGEELGLFSRKKCYILPKSLYTRLKVLKYIHGKYRVPIDDPRNVSVCCLDCLLKKGEDLCIPDWSGQGLFYLFDEDKLREYADFFYTISYPLMHMFREAIPAPGAEESMVAVEMFRKEYEWRKKNSMWEIGFPFIEEKSYETYRKSALESRGWC